MYAGIKSQISVGSHYIFLNPLVNGVMAFVKCVYALRYGAGWGSLLKSLKFKKLLGHNTNMSDTKQRPKIE